MTSNNFFKTKFCNTQRGSKSHDFATGTKSSNPKNKESMNEDSTCQAILNQYDPQLESYFDDESTLFRDLVSDTKSMSGFQESTAAAAATFLFTKRDEQPAATTTKSAPASTSIAAPAKPAAPSQQKQQQQQPAASTSIVALHTSTTKTPQRRIKTTVITPAVAPLVVPATTTTTRTVKSKPSPSKPPPMLQSADAKKKNALRSALSAFLHLHQPHMTKNEQEAMLKKYESREYEMWAMLAERFGEGSVPSRFLQSGEHAMRGSAKVVLTPKPHPDRETERLMLARSLDLEVKETVLRTMTVDMLLRELKLRWNAVEEDTQSRNLTLLLFAPGMNDALYGSQMVRDCMVDGCMEYAWTVVDHLPPVDVDISDVQEHSLLGSDWPKRQRRIQPTQVLE